MSVEKVDRDTASLVKRMMVQIGLEAGLSMEGIAADSGVMDDLGLDSLTLAEVVVRLQEETGIDPFKDGFIPFRTVGELTALFENAADERKT